MRCGPGCWPSWPTVNPPLISGSPSPESRSQNDCLEMDWDPHAEVATVRVIAWTYLFCSGGLVSWEWEKVSKGRKDVGGGL